MRAEEEEHERRMRAEKEKAKKRRKWWEKEGETEVKGPDEEESILELTVTLIRTCS